jgi:hypothetical protein
MPKLILFLLALVIGWLAFKGLARKNASRKDTPSRSASPEKMVQCTRCSVHIPESESMQRDGAVMCRTPERCLHRQNL